MRVARVVIKSDRFHLKEEREGPGLEGSAKPFDFEMHHWWRIYERNRESRRNRKHWNRESLIVNNSESNTIKFGRNNQYKILLGGFSPTKLQNNRSKFIGFRHMSLFYLVSSIDFFFYFICQHFCFFTSFLKFVFKLKKLVFLWSHTCF